MNITDLTTREQEAVAWAQTNHGWPAGTPEESLTAKTAFDVETIATQMDEAAYKVSYAQFQTLPPEKQDEIIADIEANVPVINPPIEPEPPEP